MLPIFKIDIPKRHSHCNKGGERLISGMEYYSLLLDEESQKIMRQDFCSVCWQELISQEKMGEHRSYWRSRIDTKNVKDPQAALNKIEKAFSLLKEAQAAHEKDEAEIFILALFLARAKQLILRKEKIHQGCLYHLYEVAHQDEFLMIKKIDLTSSEISQVQASLSKKL